MHTEQRGNSSYDQLVDMAIVATERSYVPYSQFRVGAALLDKSGKIWTGCNIESASYSPTNCAERTAIFKAVSEGVMEFEAIAVVGRQGDQKDITDAMTAPCGVCRQVLAEFCEPDFRIILANRQGLLEIYSLSELLPLSFTRRNLDEAGGR